MTDYELYMEITLLPDNLKNQVKELVSEFKNLLHDSGFIRDRKPGLAKGLIKMSADFDDPLDDFKDYM